MAEVIKKRIDALLHLSMPGQFWTHIAFLCALSVLPLLLLLRALFDIPFRYLAMDPSVIGNISPFVGALSNTGILIWMSAAAICLFTATQIKETQHKRFLRHSAFFTIFLLIDDLFMFHDYVWSDVVGIPEVIVLSIYLTIGLYYLSRYYKLILNLRWFYFGLSAFCLGGSLVTDVIGGHYFGQYFIEEGLKFLGIASWSIFFIQTSQDLLTEKRR